MAYIYQADIYCDDCGELIMRDLERDLEANGTLPELVDSEDWPVDIGDPGEGDVPDHCGAGCACENAIDAGTYESGPMKGRTHRVGMALENDLSDRGVQYVVDALKAGSGCVLDIWREQLDAYGLNEKQEAVVMAYDMNLSDTFRSKI